MTTTFHGKHVDITVPYDTKPLGGRLVALSDHAFERYAEWLGVSPPSGRCPIELLLPVEYERAVQRSRSPSFSTDGLTRDAGHDRIQSWVRFKLGSARSLEALPGTEENVTLHELEHCVMHLVKHGWSEDFPSWWSEGAAELFAGRALAESFAIPPGRIAAVAARVHGARRLSKNGWVSLRRLFEIDRESLLASDNHRASVLYSEGAALLHFLDTSPRYHERFAAFLRYLTGVHGFFIGRRLSTNFESLVGNLDVVDADLRAALSTDDVLPFLAADGELRPLGTSGVVVQGLPASLARKAGQDGRREEAGVGDVIDLVVTPREGDAKDVLVLFGDRNEQACHLWLTEREVPLLVIQAATKTKVVPTASSLVKAGALSAGAKTRIRVLLGAAEVEVTLDDESIFRAPLPPGLGRGRTVRRGSLRERRSRARRALPAARRRPPGARDASGEPRPVARTLFDPARVVDQASPSHQRRLACGP